MSNKKFTETITALNSQGQGICSVDGLKVFVDHALPGEKITAELFQKKKRYGAAKPLAIEIPSKKRVSPICSIFKDCGGCQIMHMSYRRQLEFKTQKVKDALYKIAQIDFEPSICLPSPLKLSYRNKIQLPFFEQGGKLKLGLYQKGTNNPITVEKCHIHCLLGEKVYATLSSLIDKFELRVFHEDSSTGDLRHLLIKTGIQTNEVLVVFIASSKRCIEKLKNLGKALMEVHTEVKGVILNINKKRYNSIAGDKQFTLLGRPFIYEKLLNRTFKISAHSFFQVNPLQAEKLYKKAIEFADLKPHQTLLDAYCGIGTLSLLAAPFVKRVIGIEVVESAILDAREAALSHQISNCTFIQELVEKYIHKIEHLDVAFINPPRKGCEKAVLEALCIKKPLKIVYISCDPATLARDIQFFCENGYLLKAAQPFDMFPQTTHVETCTLLELKKNLKSLTNSIL